jgi:RNA polymerase sigma factor (sigma-70 family)
MKHLHPPEANLFCLAALAYAAQQLKALCKDVTAPEERPPNHCAAATVSQMAPLKSPPWNEWLRLARQNDETATQLFCAQAEPFIEILCKTQYFRDRLEMDEIRSIATLAIMEFLKEYPDPPEDAKIPYMLKRIIHNRILSALKKQKVRQRREYKPVPATDVDSPEKKENCIESFPADSAYEPEQHLFRKQLDESFRQLRPNEQAVLDAYYFRNKAPAAIAAELHRSRQFVERIHKRALRRLSEMLGGPGCCPAT